MPKMWAFICDKQKKTRNMCKSNTQYLQKPSLSWWSWGQICSVPVKTSQETLQTLKSQASVFVVTVSLDRKLQTVSYGICALFTLRWSERLNGWEVNSNCRISGLKSHRKSQENPTQYHCSMSDNDDLCTWAPSEHFFMTHKLRTNLFPCMLIQKLNTVRISHTFFFPI